MDTPNYEVAYADFKNGMKYQPIADKYNVTLSAVKSWAARYWKNPEWLRDHGESCNRARLQPAQVATTSHKGGQPGNQNAKGNKGGAAPPGNKNAVKTGEFERLFFDTLDDDEKELAAMVEPDKEALLLQEIQLLTVRIRRMLLRIEDVRRTAEEVDDVNAIGMTMVGYSDEDGPEGQKTKKTYTGALGQIQAIEEALTRVQAQRQRAIEALHRIAADDARLDLELMRLDLDITSKLGAEEQEIADDGFMAALNAEAAAVWGGEEQ